MNHLYAFSMLSMLAPTGFAQNLSSPMITPSGLEPSAWSEIQAAYEAGRHRALPTKLGYEALNPKQRWLTQFDGEGFLIQPNGADWSWGLQLNAYGFEGAKREVADTGIAIAQGNRTAYDWDCNLQEWYVNDARGLEHGFTLQVRPDQSAGDVLSFDLTVRGSLQARVLADGKGVSFVNSENVPMLNYSGLHVFDANGVTQPATFLGSGKQLSIVIQESGAEYPLTIDPIAQQAYLKASNTDASDYFGRSVAVSGDTVVVAAHGEDSSATGVNGNQSDNSLSGAGAVYVFQRSGGAWTQQAYLKASNPGSVDVFGFSVDISDNLIAVGAIGESSNAAGVNGDQSNDLANRAGAVYVFERNSGGWSQQAYLKASNTDSDDYFGWSVGISGDLIVVGAKNEDSPATGVNGNQGNASYAGWSGAAYVFERSGGVWSQQAYLKASNSQQTDYFGSSVDISGERIIVGADGEESTATGVNGNQADNSLYDVGAAYVFARNGGVWSQEAYLKGPSTDQWDRFAESVSISGDVIVVGCRLEDSDAIGVNGDPVNNNILNAGAAHVFERIGGVWSQQAYLKASNPGIQDGFGGAVAISGDRIIVGSGDESSRAMGVNGNQQDNSFPDSGAAYVFERSGGVWQQQAYLKASNPAADAYFGSGLALDGDLVAVGAPYESSNAIGINGDQDNNNATRSGATYIFDLAVPVASFCGSAVQNSSGQSATLSNLGSRIAASNSFGLLASDLPVGQFGYFLYSMGKSYVANVSGSQGTLCLGGGAAIGRHHASIQQASASGTIDQMLDLTNMPNTLGANAIQAGETWNFQCWFRDQNPGSTSNFTDGLSVLFE